VPVGMGPTRDHNVRHPDYPSRRNNASKNRVKSAL
jgi:hypothetical protein